MNLIASFVFAFVFSSNKTQFLEIYFKYFYKMGLCVIPTRCSIVAYKRKYSCKYLLYYPSSPPSQSKRHTQFKLNLPKALPGYCCTAYTHSHRPLRYFFNVVEHERWDIIKTCQGSARENQSKKVDFVVIKDLRGGRKTLVMSYYRSYGSLRQCQVCYTVHVALGYVPSPFNQLLTFHGSPEATESAIRYCKNATFDLADNVN